MSEEQFDSAAPAAEPVNEGTAAAGPLHALPFWPRVAAFIADSVALGVMFWAAGWLAGPWFASLGPWGRLVGGAAGVAYFGFCGSSLAAGQTLGKRIAGIAVRRQSGGFLPLGRSLCRATLLMLPLTANGLALGSMTRVVPAVASVLLFGLGGAMLYLFLFNRRTRQSVHDLAAGSMVVRVDQSPEAIQGEVWRPHFAIIVAILCVAAGLASFGLRKLGAAVNLDALRRAQREIAAAADTEAVQVMDGMAIQNGVRTTWINASATTYVLPADQERLAREIAGVVLREVPAANTRDRIIVTITSGYDVLFARLWRTNRWNHTPREWQDGVSQ